jgi:hypothetical protein
MSEKAPPPVRAIKRIKKSRVKEGQNEYLVVYEGDEKEKGTWLPEARIDPQHLSAFQEKRRTKPAAEDGVPRPPGPRVIKEIRGVIPEGDTWRFVVRFSDSPKDESVSRADMRSTYPKQLVRFYETHLRPGELLNSLP